MRLFPARFSVSGPVAPHPGRTLKFLLLALALALACAALTGCATLGGIVTTAEPAADQASAGPNLGLLSLPAYEDTEAEAPQATAEDSGYANVDLWLDATQNMGGINTTGSDMYPHYGHKYREGGFHYKYDSTTGWYESLLRDFLAAAGETHVRTLRYGNETMTDDFLAAYGLSGADGAESASIWRDLHTCAVNTTAALFSRFSAEDMAGSFYELGSATWLNRVAALDAADLENPSLADAMSTALSHQIDGIAQDDESFVLQAGRNGEQCALLAALQNIDTDRLSVITVDPSSVRKTTGADTEGRPIAYYEQLLEDLGVFDKGLCVGILDFQLDYMGQMSTFSTADFSEPLIWGRVILNESGRSSTYVGVMPRRLLTLVVGTRAQVDGFIGSLADILDADASLKGLRGPTEGELTYAADGQTVTQQPFAFEWNETVVARPGMGYYSQHTEGVTLTAETADETAGAGQTVETGENDVPLVSLTPDAAGAQPDRVFTVRFPLADSGDGAALDVSDLSGAGLETLDTLLIGQTMSNTPENLAAAEADGQEAVAYRDKLYLFSRDEGTDAFTLLSVTQEDGALVCTVAVDGSALKAGYYRLRLTADATGDQVTWESVPFIDGPGSVSVSVTDAEVYAWEIFTAAITQYDRDAKGLPNMFKHAWGPYTDSLYHNLRVPDFPPVYKSVHLAELAAQFRDAAAADTSALVRYVFEVNVAYP